MRAILLASAILGSAIVSGGAGPLAGYATTMPATAMPGGAPIGHLQPRAGQFAPASPAEQAEQQRMSTFDAEQRKLDERLDKRLNICRC